MENENARVTITKDGETIHVHPGTLENHLKLGWKEVIKPVKAEKPVEDGGKVNKSGKKAK
jgi:hypothetical protein